MCQRAIFGCRLAEEREGDIHASRLWNLGLGALGW